MEFVYHSSMEFMGLAIDVNDEESVVEFEVENNCGYVVDEWVLVEEQNVFQINVQEQLIEKYKDLIVFTIPQEYDDIVMIESLVKLEEIVRVPRIWGILGQNPSFVELMKNIHRWLKELAKDVHSIEVDTCTDLVKISQFQCVLHLHSDLIHANQGIVQHYYLQYLQIQPFVRISESSIEDEDESIFDPSLFAYSLVQNIRHDYYSSIKCSPVIPTEETEKPIQIVQISSVELCIKELIKIAELVLCDLLGSGKDSTLSDIIIGILSNMLHDYLPEITSTLHRPLKSQESLHKDPRVLLLSQIQTFTSDYYQALKNLEAQGQSLRPDSQENAFKLIEMLVAVIEQRGGVSVTSSIGIDKDILRHNPQALSAILDAVKSKIVSNTMSVLFPDTNPKIYSAIAKVMEKCFDKLIEFVTDPSLWLVVLHRLPRLISERLSPEDIENMLKREKNREKRSDISKDHAIKLGLEVFSVVSNLTNLCQPKGISGFFIRIGRHLLKYFVKDLGSRVIDDLENPIDPSKLKSIADLVLSLLWDENSCGEYVFIGNQSVFKNLKAQIDKEMKVRNGFDISQRYAHIDLTKDIREVIMNDLSNLFRDIVIAGIPKTIGTQYFLPKSLKSLHALLWSLIDVFVGISQSPELMEFIILQYCAFPLSQ